MWMDAGACVRRLAVELPAHLDHDLHDHQQEDARNVVCVVVEAEVLVTAMALAVDLARGQHPVARVAGEKIAAARALRMEQSLAAGELLLELRDVLQRRTAHDAPLRAVPPAEGDDALVVAEQDPGLARAGLRREIGLPAHETVGSLVEPPSEVRHLPRRNRLREDRLGEAVDLQEEHTGHVGRERGLSATGRPPHDPAVVRVVDLVERGGAHDLHEREHERDHHSVPEAHRDAGEDPGSEESDDPVQQEREEAEREERERKRQPQRERPEDGVQKGDECDECEPGPEAVDRESVERLFEQQQHGCLRRPQGSGEKETPRPRSPNCHPLKLPGRRRRAASSRGGDAARGPPRQPAHVRRKIVVRVVMLALTAVSLYLLAPSLLSIFSSWPELRHLQPAWFALAVAFEALSYLSLWSLQRIALRTRSWFAVGTSQLAAGAAGSLMRGGGGGAAR